MTIADALIIIATLSGPIIAVQVTRFLDERKETRGRKLQVFKTLMSTRAYAPIAHGRIEEKQEAIRSLAIEFLQGKRVLPLFVTNLGNQPNQVNE